MSRATGDRTSAGFRKSLLVLGGALGALLLAEVGLGIGSHVLYPRLVTTSSELGWKYRPTPHPVMRRIPNGSYRVFINPDGFRDDPFTRQTDAVRIMVLGDSMTFGMEVDQSELFCSLLEKRLQSLSAAKVDVMNFGITGFGTGQELLCFEQYEPRYPPAAVVLMLLEVNDFQDNFCVMAAGRFVPHFALEHAELVLQNRPTATQRLTTFLRERSFLAYFLANQLQPTRSWFTSVQPATTGQQIELMTRLLDALHRLTQAKGEPLLLVYIKSPDSDDVRWAAVRECCRGRGIDVVHIVLKAEETGLWGHWNSTGHRMVADVLYKHLMGLSEVRKKLVVSDPSARRGNAL